MSLNNVQQKPVLIWDVGGVILEWDPLSLSESYENGRYKDQCLAIFDHENWRKFDRGDLSYGDLLKIYSEQFSFPEEKIAEILKAAYHSLRPRWPVIHLIQKLKKLNYEQYCLSNGSVEYFTYVTGASYFSAYQFSLLQLFNKDQIIISAAHKIAKPEFEIYRLAVDTFSIKDKKIIFIDDSHANINGALAAGWWQAICFEDIEGCLTALEGMGINIDL